MHRRVRCASRLTPPFLKRLGFRAWEPRLSDSNIEFRVADGGLSSTVWGFRAEDLGFMALAFCILRRIFAVLGRWCLQSLDTKPSVLQWMGLTTVMRQQTTSFRA